MNSRNDTWKCAQFWSRGNNQEEKIALNELLNLIKSYKTYNKQNNDSVKDFAEKIYLNESGKYTVSILFLNVSEVLRNNLIKKGVKLRRCRKEYSAGMTILYP